MIVDFLYDFWVNHDIMYDHSLALFSFEQVIALIRDGKKNREKKHKKSYMEEFMTRLCLLSWDVITVWCYCNEVSSDSQVTLNTSVLEFRASY